MSAATPFQPTYAAITAAHDTSGFDCGDAARNAWLQTHALRSERGPYSRTIIRLIGNRVTAFYCLSASSVARTDLPSAMRHGAPNPVPMALLGQLGVDKDLHGQGIGSRLVVHAFERVVLISQYFGCAFLGVNPAQPWLFEWYGALGFKRIRGVTPDLMLISDPRMQAILAASSA